MLTIVGTLVILYIINEFSKGFMNSPKWNEKQLLKEIALENTIASRAKAFLAAPSKK